MSFSYWPTEGSPMFAGYILHHNRSNGVFTQKSCQMKDISSVVSQCAIGRIQKPSRNPLCFPSFFGNQIAMTFWSRNIAIACKGSSAVFDVSFLLLPIFVCCWICDYCRRQLSSWYLFTSTCYFKFQMF